MTYSCMLWYINHGHFIMYKLKRSDKWLEWRPENHYSDKFDYKIVDKVTWEEKKCT